MGGLDLQRYHADLTLLPDDERREKIRRAKSSTVRQALSAEAPANLVLMFADRVGEVAPDLQLIECGRVRELQREFGEAEELYRQALNNGDERASLRLADTLGQQGRLEEALPYYKRAVENGFTLPHLRRLASQHRERGEFQEALTVFSLIWKAGIRDVADEISGVIEKWLTAIQQGGNKVEDLIALIKALQLEAQQGNSLIALAVGGIIEDLDMGAAVAVEYYDLALGSVCDLEARKALADLFFGQKDFEQAIPHLRVLTQAGDKQALFSLGVALWLSNNPDHLDEVNRVVNEALDQGDWRMVWGLTLGGGMSLEEVEGLYRYGLMRGHNQMLVGLAHLAEKRGDNRTKNQLLLQAREAGVNVEVLQDQLQQVEAAIKVTTH